ncbi:MAG: SNF2-related protein [Candidatus Sericytochromatia bacterium]
MRPLSENEILAYFGYPVVQQSRFYLRNRIKILSCEAPEDRVTLLARVSGSQREPYVTSLRIVFDHERVEFEGRCSCATGQACKHQAALALHYARLQTGVTPQHQVENWLSQLDAVSPLAPFESSEIQLYLFSPGEEIANQLSVSIVRRKRLGSGAWGRPQPVNVEEELYTNGFAPDLDILRLLTLMREEQASFQHAGPYALEGAAGQAIVDQILSTARGRWLHADGQPLQAGPARRLEMNWQGEGSHLILAPHLPLFLVQGALYLDLSTGQMGTYILNLPVEQLHMLLNMPGIPEEMLTDVMLRLWRKLPALPAPAGLDLDIVEINDVEPEPQAVLRSLPGLGDHQPMQHLIFLEFDYDGVLIPHSSDAISMVQQDGLVYRIQRDLKRETEAVQALEDTGLLRLSNDPPAWGFACASALELAEAWEHWLENTFAQLEDSGWQLHVSDDFRLRIYADSDWQAELAEDSGWFNLSLGVEIQGQTVNLLPLLVNLLQQASTPQALRAYLQNHSTLLIPLGDERWMRAPSARLAPLLETLLDLYEQEPLDAEGHLRLSWLDGLQLGPLYALDGLSWAGADDLRRLAQRLQDFDGIAEQPLPEGLQAELRPYQHAGYNWLQFLREYGFHGILADDMGLGKTLQTLAHLLAEKNAGRLSQPALVVVPTSLLGNWQHEAQRFTPSLRVQVLYGKERHSFWSELAAYDLIISSYDLVRRDLQEHQQQHYSYLILDESQKIKNPGSQISQAICQVPAQFRLCLSGTPIENHLGELWSLFRFLMPGLLGNTERFNRRFRNPIEKHGDRARQHELQRRIQPFLLRRRKSEVEKELPAKTEMVRFVRLEDRQRDLYETLRVAMHGEVRQAIQAKGLARSQMVILDALLKLRQACCDPRLVKLPAAGQVRQSAKLELLLGMLAEMVEEGRRILVFSQFVEMLRLIQTGLEQQGLDYGLLTGQTRQRDAVVQAFQRGEFPIFLISLKAGGVGLNLTAADTVVHYDPWWNPAVENQATDRAWRIGQDKPVFVYKLIAEQTVEEKILQLQARKQTLSEGIYVEGGSASLKVEAEDLLALLQE